VFARKRASFRHFELVLKVGPRRDPTGFSSHIREDVAST